MTKTKIAIIEDDGLLCKIIAERLCQEGFEVVQAHDGETGFALVEAEKPALVLLDIILPKMDGITLFRKMRKAEWGKNIPVIVLTNLTLNDEIIKDVKEFDFSHYLVKLEWSLDDVVDKVKEVLDGKRANV